MGDTQPVGAYAGLMRSLGSATPPRAAATAAALTVLNPKVLFVSAAGFDTGTAGLGSTRAWIAVAYFVAVAGSTVAIPVLAYAVSGDRLDEPLRRLKDGWSVSIPRWWPAS